MTIIGGLKPSELDVATINALNDALGAASNSILYGYGLVNIRRKLRTMEALGKPLSSIKVAIMADSIFQSTGLADDIVDYFVAEFGLTEANIDINCCWGAYTHNQYMAAIDGAVVQPNVDLFIFSEDPRPRLTQSMLNYVRQHCNCDIMLGTWSVRTDSYLRYNSIVDQAKIHDCELLDINAILLRKYLDGTLATYMANVVHPNAAGTALIYDDFIKHFESTRYNNEYTNGVQRETLIFPGGEKMLPTNSGLTFSGAWTAATDGVSAKSSTATDYIEVVFTGIGFEAAFGSNIAANVHNILIDSAAPSAYVKANGYSLEYCTQIIGKTQTNQTWYFHRFFAAYVTAPFMANAEEEVEFEITLDTVTRDGGGILTVCEYTLRQGVDVLGTGDIFTDATFVFRTTGEITIPAIVYGVPNYWEVAGYPFTVGDTMQFFARKTWRDSIDTNAETYLRVSGLDRGAHTMRITKANAVETSITYISIYK